ncbi:MAG: TolC family protein [Bryobacteraceae bacterium]|jgi:outer membrane protein
MEKRTGKPYRSAAIVAFCAGRLLAQAPAQSPPILTLRQAETMALQNHPRIKAAQYELAFGNQQIVETRSAYLPTVNADVTGSGANSGARIGAGFITDSRLFDRFGAGLTFTQLITDLGRTRNLVASSRLDAQAGAQNVEATRYDVLLQVNRAYFDVLHAQALIRTAQETIGTRQTVLNQVTQLAQNQLRSQLDVSFANVNVSEAKLLLIQSQNSLDEAYAELAQALGAAQVVNYQVQEEALPPGPPGNPDDLVAQAIANRPEFAGLRLSRDAAYKFAEAEKDLQRPTINAVGVAGYLPYIDQLTSQAIPAEYAAGAVNVSIPIFNGHLFTARREAALDRAMEADQRLRDEQLRLSRDVRVAWANASTAYQRIDVTAQLVQQANMAVNLAQGRYNLGLASIVELSQSQLNQTQAEIENLSARYDYQSQYQALQYTIGQLR